MRRKTAKPLATKSRVIDPVHAEPSAWNPSVDTGLKLNTNPFEKFDFSGNSTPSEVNASVRMTIQDATVDTAPLQGSKDLSDKDHLGS